MMEKYAVDEKDPVEAKAIELSKTAGITIQKAREKYSEEQSKADHC